MTTEPFADQHAVIQAAHSRIDAAHDQIHAALSRIPKPPGVITGEHDDESWDYWQQSGEYRRPLTMGRWQVPGTVRAEVAEVALSVEQTQTGALRDWSIYLGTYGDEMTADDARRLASVLLEAATALEASRPA